MIRRNEVFATSEFEKSHAGPPRFETAKFSNAVRVGFPTTGGRWIAPLLVVIAEKSICIPAAAFTTLVRPMLVVPAVNP